MGEDSRDHNLSTFGGSWSYRLSLALVNLKKKKERKEKKAQENIWTSVLVIIFYMLFHRLATSALSSGTMCVCMHAKSLQSCSALYDPMNCNLPGSSVHGILQARILERVAISFSGDLPNAGTKPTSLTALALANGFFTTSATWKDPKTSKGDKMEFFSSSSLLLSSPLYEFKRSQKKKGLKVLKNKWYKYKKDLNDFLTVCFVFVSFVL